MLSLPTVTVNANLPVVEVLVLQPRFRELC